jgi:hypothetical protein
MLDFLKAVWNRITDFIFPQDYYSWQTLIYLGIFSFAMSWLARLADTFDLTENIIATAGWIFFAIGIGWFLEKNHIRLFGIPIAPWVVGAIVCGYFFGLVPWGDWEIGLMAWPLVSVAIVAVPQFFTWELRPKVPVPVDRQNLILLLLIALLLSNWFQFYFRLQSWLNDYPSVLTDDFRNSGFVIRLGEAPNNPAQGAALLTAAEQEIKASLNDTPWSYVKRWLLNLDEQMVMLRTKTNGVLEGSEEQTLWRLDARRPRSLDNSEGYALDLMAVWSGPASSPTGYHLVKTCVIHPRTDPQPLAAENSSPPSPTPVAEVECDLATPKQMGQPPFSRDT